MSSESNGVPLGWLRIAALQIGLILSLLAVLANVDGNWTVVAWSVASLIEVGLIVEAIRTSRFRSKD